MLFYFLGEVYLFYKRNLYFQNCFSGSNFDMGIGFNRKFGGMDINAGISNGKPKFTITKNAPDQSRRYQRGWGSSRGDRRVAASQPPMKLEGKTYQEIKAQCLREGRLFEDPDFPAIDKSLFYSRTPPRPFEWKRPSVSIMRENNYFLLIVVNSEHFNSRSPECLIW